MRRSGPRRQAVLRLEVLEARTLLSRLSDTPWPLDDVSPDRSVLVRFHERAPQAATDSLLKTVGGRVLREFTDGPQLVGLGRGVRQDAALRYLQASPLVVYAEPNVAIQVSAHDGPPNDPLFPQQWGLDNPNGPDIDALSAWSITTGSPLTIVAVLDTGIDVTHPDLVDRLWVNPTAAAEGRVVHGWNFVTATSDVRDDNGHGTHVAGTIAASGNNGEGVIGVAPAVTIMALKVLDADGGGALHAAIDAVYYAANHGARVINASWSGGSSSRAMSEAIRYAGERGAVFVAAAGNERANNDQVPSYPGNHRLPNLLSVTAIDARGNLARYANYGGATVDLAGPGDGILSTSWGGRYEEISGTSMAVPHVSGVAALLASQHPDWSASQIVGRIKATVEPLPSLAGRTITGGVVNAARALNPSLGSSAEPTSPPSTPAPALSPSPTPPPTTPPVATVTPDDVHTAILASPEYYQRAGGTASGFVAALYRDLLGRDLDPTGQQVWTSQLQNGASRDAIAQAILKSEEARRTTIARIYREDLGRTASLEQLKNDPGVIVWAGALLSGVRLEDIRATILGSDEYYRRAGGTASGFVATLYRDLLGRDAEAGGLALWTSQLQNGMGRHEVARAILASEEGRRALVARLYRDELGRTASLEQLKNDAGVAAWARVIA